MTRKSRLALSAGVFVSVPLAALAQQQQRPMPMGAPGVTQPLTPDQIARENPPNALAGAAVDKPVVLKGMGGSIGGMSIRVVKLAEGLSHPDGLVFLPDGQTMLMTERAGRLRVVKDGVLDPNPVAGVPAMDHVALGGLQDIALHPDFAKNHLLYLLFKEPGTAIGHHPCDRARPV